MSAVQPYPVSEDGTLRKVAKEERALFPPVRKFEVHPWLKNQHLMTVVAEYWPRNLSALPPVTERPFQVEDLNQRLGSFHDTSVESFCYFFSIATLLVRHRERGDRAMGTHNELGGITKADEKFKISVVSAKDQLTRIQGAVARLAFLEEGCSLGHEVETWRRAKSELVGPLCHSQMIRDDDIWVETDTREFKEGTVEILVSPRHVTICGKPRKSRIGEVTKEKDLQHKNEIVFRTLELPLDVEPSAVTAKLNGPILELCFPKVRVKAAGQSR